MQTQILLKEIFQKVTTISGKHENKEQEKSGKYGQSGIEKMIGRVLKECPERAIFVTRNLQGLDLNDPDVSRYTDFLKENGRTSVLDADKQRRLARLKERISSNITELQHLSFTVHWSRRSDLKSLPAGSIKARDGGLDPRHNEHHMEYLDNLHAQVVKHLEAFIKVTVKIDKNESVNTEAECSADVSSDKIKLKQCLRLDTYHAEKLYRSIGNGECNLIGVAPLQRRLEDLMTKNAKEHHYAVLLQGHSGTGKSSLMAWLSRRLQHSSVLGPDTVVLRKFCRLPSSGAASTNATELLRSICISHQLHYNFNIDTNINNLSNDNLITHYSNLINNMSEKSSHFIVFIDGLEQLSTASTDPIKLDWLTWKFPPKLHMVVTFTRTDRNQSAYQNFADKLPGNQYEVAVDGVGVSAVETMLEKVCGQENRKYSLLRKMIPCREYVTDEVHKQTDIKDSGIDEDTFGPIIVTPLQATLWIEDVLNAWRVRNLVVGQTTRQTVDENKTETTTQKTTSQIHTIPNQQVNTKNSIITTASIHEGSDSSFAHTLPTLDDTILQRFKCLEETWGVELISHVIRYFCCCHHGLTQLEVCDLLSLNDHVLRLIYTDMTTPLRFPYPTWNAIYSEMGQLLEERHLDGKTVLHWSHDCIHRIATERYIKTRELYQQTHHQIAELFMETWLYGKPIEIEEQPGNSITETTKSPQYSESSSRSDSHSSKESSPRPHNEALVQTLVPEVVYHNRCVCMQPLLLSESKYNLRKLAELWYQLIHAGKDSIREFKEHTFFNFEYLLSKLHSTNIRELMLDLNTACHQVLDAELCLLVRCFTKSLAVLCKDPIQLANELIGRLRRLKDYYPDFIDGLIKQSMAWCDDYNLPIVVPLSCWLPDPRKTLVMSLLMTSNVTCFCTTECGQYVFCGTSQGDVLMYQVSSKQRIVTLGGHCCSVMCMCLTSDSKQVITASTDGTVRCWKIESTEIVLKIRVHTDAILCMTLRSDNVTLITGSKDRTFRVTSLITGALIYTCSIQEGAINNVLLNSTESLLITTASTNKVFVMNTEDYGHLNTIDQNIPDTITNIALTIDNTFIIAACSDQSLHVITFITGTYLHALQGHHSQVSSLAVSSDCFHVVVGCSDGSLSIYNLRTTEHLDLLKDHNHIIAGLCITTDQYFIYSVDQEKFNVWTFNRSHTKSIHSDEHNENITCMDIISDGRMGITGGKDNVAKLWNLDICDFQSDLEGHFAPVTCVTFATDEAFAVTGSEDTTIKVWSVMMGCVITDYREHHSMIMYLRILDNNERVFSAEEDGKVRVWKAADGETILKVRSPVNIIDVSPNCQYAVSGEGDHELSIWSVSDGELVKSISHSKAITCIAYSRDSQYVTTGAKDTSLKVWDTSTGKLTQALVEHTEAVTCAAITNDNQHIVSGSIDTSLMIWNLTTGVVEHLLKGHDDAISTVKTTADSSLVISGCRDHTVRVWSISYGTPITTFNLHAPVLDLQMTSSGRHIMVHIANSPALPLLCFHNTPVGVDQSQSQISIRVSSEVSILPIKPHSPEVTKASIEHAQTNHMRRCSVSSIPEMTHVSPIHEITPPKPIIGRATRIQTTVKAQENKKEERESKVLKDASSIERVKPAPSQSAVKKSSLCTLL